MAPFYKSSYKIVASRIESLEIVSATADHCGLCDHFLVYMCQPLPPFFDFPAIGCVSLYSGTTGADGGKILVGALHTMIPHMAMLWTTGSSRLPFRALPANLEDLLISLVWMPAS